MLVSKENVVCSAVVLCGLQLAVQGQSPVTTLRGVLPRLREVYRPGPDGEWACLAGGHVLDFAKVNDDYCDCLDGSDEPGMQISRRTDTLSFKS